MTQFVRLMFRQYSAYVATFHPTTPNDQSPLSLPIWQADAVPPSTPFVLTAIAVLGLASTFGTPRFCA
jgi:hypothetical protein